VTTLLQRLAARARARLPVIIQSEASECALACLAMVAGFYGKRCDLVALRRRLPVSLRGTSLKSVMQLAGALGLACRAVRVDLNGMGSLKRPALLHWNFTHFVVLKAVSRRWIDIHDPAVGARRYRLSEVSDHFTGVAVEVGPGQAFERAAETRRLSLLQFIGNTVGLKRSLLLVIALSALAQVFALTTPFYIQLVVDDVLIRHDADLLLVLAAGFLLLTVFAVLSRAVRGLAQLHLVNQLSLLFGVKLFSHLIRLPLAYFEKRPIGDVLSRFGSLRPLQDFVTSSAVAALIDGVLALGALAMMLLYAPMLAVVATAAMLVYAALRLAVYRSYRNRTHDEIIAQADAETCLVEPVQALRSIRSYRSEPQRDSDWHNRLVDVVNGGARVRRLEIGHDGAQGIITGIEHVAVVYLGAQMVLAGGMTIGMLYAFLAYRGHFTGAMTSLVDQLIRFRMVGLHLDRLAEIATTELDASVATTTPFSRPVRSGVRLAHAGYRYGVTDPVVIENATVEIRLGTFTALCGPSGSGKTTLLKLLAAHLDPHHGSLEVDGQPLEVFGAASYRACTASVMQQDRLMSGTLRDNISFFDPEPDAARLERATRAALIYDEIASMPMGFDSLVGDMGNSLSAGQEQRVQIARALYRQPTILFLDEGTAHIDEARERLIMTNLRELGVTCVYTSHRASIIAMADQRITLPRGGDG
jgi:ATP-binding cassette, subfamily B, bacterial CvaB/MchF/RaxB